MWWQKDGFQNTENGLGVAGISDYGELGTISISWTHRAIAIASSQP
jgi:hypothetical protein